MKFLNIFLAAATFAPSVLGAPVFEERDVTPASAIETSLGILQDMAYTNEQAMTTAIGNARDNVSAFVEIAAGVKANLQAIADGFKKAGDEIVDAIVKAGGGIQGQAVELSDAEVRALQAALEKLQQILAGISATITFEVTNLIPSASAMIQAEVDFVFAAIAPVVNPIMVFADAATHAQAKVTATVRGVGNAYYGVGQICNNMAKTNGLPGVAFPGFMSVNV